MDSPPVVLGSHIANHSAHIPCWELCHNYARDHNCLKRHVHCHVANTSVCILTMAEKDLHSVPCLNTVVGIRIQTCDMFQRWLISATGSVATEQPQPIKAILGGAD